MERCCVVSTTVKAKLNSGGADITTPMHTDRQKVTCSTIRLSAAGDWHRYADEVIG
jgi:hypothetical protein